MYRERNLVAVQCSSCLACVRYFAWLTCLALLRCALHEICTSPYRASAKQVTFGKLKIAQNMGNRFSHVAFKGAALYLPILNLSMAHQIRFRFVVQTRASFTRLSWKQPRFLAIQIPFGRNTAFQTNKRCNGSELLKGRVSYALEPRFLSYLFSFARFSGRVPQQREPITAVPWRPDHNIGNSVPYSLRMMSGFFNVPQLFYDKGCETGPPAYIPYPDRGLTS